MRRECEGDALIILDLILTFPCHCIDVEVKSVPGILF